MGKSFSMAPRFAGRAMARLRQRVQRLLLRPAACGDLIRLGYGAIARRRGDPRIFDRARFHILLRVFAGFIRRRGMRGGHVTEAGEYYLAMPDGLLLYYNFSDPRATRGDGQSLDFIRHADAPRLEQFIIDQVQDGSTYFDVGANNGYYYALKLGRRHPGAHIFAFEPDPKILGHLRRNIEINNIANVRIVPVALADKTGRAAMTAALGASNFLVADGQEPSAEELITVARDTIDDFLEREKIADPCLIKIDIEGGEFAFLQGAAVCIVRCQPILVMELDDQWLRRAGVSLDELMRLLETWRYTCFRVADTADAIAFPASKLDRFPAGGDSWLARMARS
jgi:FkbM family methyltransferase